MHPDLSENAIKKIEGLCAQGCSQVNQLLDRAKNGEVITELNEFNHSETKLIIKELDQIMSIYQSDNADGFK